MVKRGDLGFVGMLCLWGMGYSFNTRNECAWNVTYNWGSSTAGRVELECVTVFNVCAAGEFIYYGAIR